MSAIHHGYDPPERFARIVRICRREHEAERDWQAALDVFETMGRFAETAIIVLTGDGIAFHAAINAPWIVWRAAENRFYRHDEMLDVDVPIDDPARAA